MASALIAAHRQSVFAFSVFWIMACVAGRQPRLHCGRALRADFRSRRSLTHGAPDVGRGPAIGLWILNSAPMRLPSLALVLDVLIEEVAPHVAVTLAADLGNARGPFQGEVNHARALILPLQGLPKNEL